MITIDLSYPKYRLKPFTFSPIIPSFQGLNQCIQYIETHQTNLFYNLTFFWEKPMILEWNGVGINMRITSPKTFLSTTKIKNIIDNLLKGNTFMEQFTLSQVFSLRGRSIYNHLLQVNLNMLNSYECIRLSRRPNPPDGKWNTLESRQNTLQ